MTKKEHENQICIAHVVQKYQLYTFSKMITYIFKTVIM